jgi:hypothetical protein
MLRRTARILLVAILMFSIGLHWIVLQSAAWAGMFIDFARAGSVIEAVEKTFDGQHACPLCKKVKEGSQDSKRKQSPKEDDSVKVLDAVLVSHLVIIPPAGETISFAPLRVVLIQRNEMPEPPPPRRGLV